MAAKKDKEVKLVSENLYNNNLYELVDYVFAHNVALAVLHLINNNLF